jgi:hypothetical protein
MEVQLTDFENAAFTVFVVLVTRVMLAFDLSFYIPLSKVCMSALIEFMGFRYFSFLIFNFSIIF